MSHQQTSYRTGYQFVKWLEPTSNSSTRLALMFDLGTIIATGRCFCSQNQDHYHSDEQVYDRGCCMRFQVWMAKNFPWYPKVLCQKRIIADESEWITTQ